MKDRIIIAVDPGVAACGICVWMREDFVATGDSREKLPALAEVLKPRPGLRAASDRTQDLLQQIHHMCVRTREWSIAKICCEIPVLFAGAKGHAAARNGDLTDLAFFAGALAQYAWQQNAKFEGVTVPTWKGQLPKTVVHQRIVNLLGNRAYSVLSAGRSHDWDACGIGLHIMGHRMGND